MNTLAITDAEAGAIAGGFIGASLAILIACALAFYVLTVIAAWKIFKKAGEKGWKSLIPIYNLIVMFRIAGISPWWILVVVVLAVIPCFTGNYIEVYNAELDVSSYQYVMTSNVFGNIMVWISNVVSLFVEVYFAIRLAKAFNKGTGFTIGLVLLPNIFWLILGFGKAKYDKKAALKA